MNNPTWMISLTFWWTRLLNTQLIPEIVIIPTSDVSFGFNDFELAAFHQLIISLSLIRLRLRDRTQHQQALSRAMGVATEDGGITFSNI